MNRIIPNLFDDLEVGITVHDPETGEILGVNSRLETLYGYTKSELRELEVADYSVAEEGFTQSKAEGYIRAAAEGEPQTFDWHVERADGKQVWISVRLVRTTLDGDSYVVAEIRDITDRKETEQEREEILNRMSDGFFAVDSSWRITHANEQGTEVLSAAMGRELSSTDVEGLHLWEEIPDAVDTTIHEQYRTAMENQESVTFEEYYAPLDTWFDNRIYPSETGLSVYFYDVTERHRQRELLEHREWVLRQLHSVISDRDRAFTEQVEELLALGRSELDIEYGTLSEIQGENYVFEVVETDDDRVQSGDIVPVAVTNCEQVARENRTLVYGDIARDAPEQTDKIGYTEMGISSYIGAPLVVDDSVYGTFCFYDTDPREGQFTEWEVTLVELMSGWVNYELQRQSANKRLQRQNKKLEQFASTVSHDLRNPLNVLAGSLELAEETGETEYFEPCYRAVDRMNTLIDELLSLAQAGETIDEMRAVRLDSIIENGWNNVDTETARLQIETTQTVRADGARLQQLVENLFRNSVEHGGEGVTITIGALPNGFYIEDNGTGIPTENQETVLESGYSTSEDGTGFGLAIVTEIAEAHDWQVDVTTGATGGARFEFTGVSIGT